MVLKSFKICFEGIELILPDLKRILTDFPIKRILAAVSALTIEIGTSYKSRV